jgi:hypothetical protein
MAWEQTTGKLRKGMKEKTKHILFYRLTSSVCRVCPATCGDRCIGSPACHPFDNTRIGCHQDAVHFLGGRIRSTSSLLSILPKSGAIFFLRSVCMLPWLPIQFCMELPRSYASGKRKRLFVQYLLLPFGLLGCL